MVQDTLREPSANKIFAHLISLVVVGHFCNNVMYQALKSNTRPKFLNIGLKFCVIILQAVNEKSSAQHKEAILGSVIHKDFLRIFVKNFQT